MDPLKMYCLLKIVIFHCYVSLPECISSPRNETKNWWFTTFFQEKPCRSSYWTMRFLSVFSEDYTFSEDSVSNEVFMVLLCFPPVSDMEHDHLGSLDGAWCMNPWIAHWAFQLSIETLHWAGSTLYLSFWSFRTDQIWWMNEWKIWWSTWNQKNNQIFYACFIRMI